MCCNLFWLDFCFKARSQASLGWPASHYVAQVGLELTASWVLVTHIYDIASGHNFPFYLWLLIYDCVYHLLSFIKDYFYYLQVCVYEEATGIASPEVVVTDGLISTLWMWRIGTAVLEKDHLILLWLLSHLSRPTCLFLKYLLLFNYMEVYVSESGYIHVSTGVQRAEKRTLDPWVCSYSQLVMRYWHECSELYLCLCAEHRWLESEAADLERTQVLKWGCWFRPTRRTTTLNCSLNTGTLKEVSEDELCTQEWGMAGMRWDRLGLFAIWLVTDQGDQNVTGGSQEQAN